MKLNIKKYTSWIAISIAGLLTAYFILLYISVKTVSFDTATSQTIETPDADTAFGGIFAGWRNNDSFPHYKYRRIEDSVNKVKQARDYINNSAGGNGIAIGYLGIAALPINRIVFPDLINDPVVKSLIDSSNKLMHLLNAESDTAVIEKLRLQIKLIDKDIIETQKKLIVSQQAEEKKNQLYYLTLKGFSLPFNTIFFIANGNYNLAYPKWDTVNSKKISSINGHYERKQIPVRYATQEKKIMIPISKKQYDLIYIAIQFIPLLLLFFAGYIFIGLPIQIVVNISKGKAFTEKNIRYFRLMSVTLFIIALANMFIPYLINYAFRNYIPPDFEYKSFYENAGSYISAIFIAAGLFIVSIAFKKGYNLQQEQDLTF